MSSSIAIPSQGKSTNKLWLRHGNKIAPYLFVSPFFLIFGVFGLFPLIFSLYLSFHYWEPAAGLASMEWVGFENYLFALGDEWFQTSIYNTIEIALKSGIPQHAVALPLAFFIHTSFSKMRNTVIGVYFVPYITSTVAISLVFTTLFSRDFGMVNQMLTYLGNISIGDIKILSWLFPTENVDWNRPEYTKDMISFVVFWRFVGWNTVLYLSALQTIPKDIYEAAIIDGANRYQQFWHITLPMLKPMAFFAVTLTIIGNLQLFEEPFIITGGTGGLEQAGKTAAMHMYITAFVESDFGTASAISWILFMFIAGLTWLNNKLLGGNNQ
ncbi:cytochrome C biogenesis protein [Photobacterium gaetbulicola]|uniref:Cytochrome C biogenesis protein n=1 Tax=Photobacterium gaetbulicola TaxID=1295392 RepID=A0A0B9GL57_9GAMM|nr:sugar ABC transporter permease [Photobacterium gaetbulicola]KHT65585.1 cytochrome C biogenesis protein [Photobacterium gaetbulicola]